MFRSTYSRRTFLRHARCLAAGSAVPYWFGCETSRANTLPAKNDRPLVGAIGMGGRGSAITKQASQLGDVVAVCDVDLRRAERAKAEYGDRTEVYQDYRRLLDRQDIDVVINGTPDHWHTAINIAA